MLYGYYEGGKCSEDVVLFRIDGEGTDLMWDKQQEKEYMQVIITRQAQNIESIPNQ